MIPRRSLILCLLFALTTASVSAQTPSSFENLSADQLVTLLLDSESRSERITLSQVLVRKHAGTKEALLAKAFLEFREGRHDAGIKLYRDLLAQNPDFVPALLLLADSLDPEESVEFYERAIEKNASAHDFAPVKGAYSAHSTNLRSSPKSDPAKDRQTIEALLAKWEQRAPDAYVFDYLRGLEAERADDDAKAEEFYKKAINKQAPDFEVYSQLVHLRLRGTKPDTSEEELKHYLDPVNDFIIRNPSADQPHIFLAGLAFDIAQIEDATRYAVFSKVFTEKPTSQLTLKILEKALEVQPTEANELLMYSTLLKVAAASGHESGREFQQKAYDRLLQAGVKFPKSHPIFETLADHVCTYLSDSRLAISHFEKAIANAQLVNDRTDNVISLGHRVYGQLLFDQKKAEQIFRAEMGRGGDKLDLLFALYINSRNSQDFNSALKYLDEFEGHTRTLNTNEYDDAILDRRRQINTLLNSANQTAAFYRDNQFLKYWQEKIGSLVLTINYSPGSAVIPPEDYPKLAKAATLLKERGASLYVFAIQGHADNTSADRSLAQQRADEVREHLHKTHGIELPRMQPEGFGADFPIASNQTAAGRAKNRRVEIVPVGSFLDPRISATAAMNAGGVMAVSPDSRYLAVGSHPIQIWDTRDHTKVKDLGRGGVRVKFSPNGRYVATALHYLEVGGFVTNVLVVYDVKTGLAVNQVPWSDRITHFDWDPFSEKIVYSVAPNQIVIYDLATRRNIKQRASPGSLMTGGDILLWTRDGEYIVAGRPNGRQLQVYDAQSLVLEKELPGTIWPHALAQTKDEMYLVCTAQSDNPKVRTLTAWKTSDWSMRQMEVPALATDLVAHPEKHMVALNDFGCSAKDGDKCVNSSVLVDLDEMKVLDMLPVGDVVVEHGFSSNGNRLYQARYDRIEVIDVSNRKLQALTPIRGTSIRPHASAADLGNKYFLSVDNNGIHVWSVTTGKKVHTWNRSVDSFGAFKDRSDYFWGIDEDRARQQSKVWTFDTKTFAEKEILTLDFDVDEIATSPEVIALAGKKFQPDQVGAPKGTVEVYSRSSWALKKKFETRLIRARLRYGFAFDSGFTALAVNRSGTEVAFATFWQDGFGHSNTFSIDACMYNLTTGSEAGCMEIGGAVKELSYDKDNDTQLEITSRLRTYVVDTQALKHLSFGKHRASEERIKLKNGGEVFWAGNYIKYIPQAQNATKELYFDGDLVGVAVYEDRNLLVTLNNANEISFYDLHRGLHELAILSKNNNEWIAYTPTGHFIASEHGTDKVFWSLGDRSIEFSALRAGRESRDIIATKLEAIANLTATRSPSLIGISRSFDPPYEFELPPTNEFQTPENQYELVLKVRTKEANLPQPTISFEHQHLDLPPNAPGTKITQDGPGVYTIKRVFDLADGNNYIEVYLHYEAAQHRKAKITVTKLGVQSPPTLWFVGLAVKSYRDQSKTLQFPIDDVSNIQTELQKQEGEKRIYKKVAPKTLVEDQVNFNNVNAELLAIFDKAAPNDVVMLYISGHGSLNQWGSLVLMPFGSDLKDPSNALNVTDLLTNLGQSPKTMGKKVMVFLDICFAGSLAGSKTTAYDMEKALRGVPFFSANDGKSANEGRPPKFSNGYFAKAILETLRGTGTRSLGQERGKIVMSELVSYVKTRVYEETNGAQQPISRGMERFDNDEFAVCPPKSSGGSPD